MTQIQFSIKKLKLMILWNPIKVHDTKAKITTKIISSSNNLKRQEFAKCIEVFPKTGNPGPSREWRVQSVL